MLARCLFALERHAVEIGVNAVGREQFIVRADLGDATLVEDNDAVRRQTLAMLRSCGLRTLEARDADSALQQLQSQPQVDVLVANVTLPGLLSGVDLAQAAREQWPHLAVLLTTGGARGALAERVEAAGLPVLRKPFTARDLTQALLFEVRGRTPPRDPPAD